VAKRVSGMSRTGYFIFKRNDYSWFKAVVCTEETDSLHSRPNITLSLASSADAQKQMMKISVLSTVC